MPLKECQIKGCRHLQTHCLGCGRLVIEKVLPRTLDWIFMKDEKPTEDGEILFTSNLTDERIGTACVENKLVILRHTDIAFDDIICWIPIPEVCK